MTAETILSRCRALGIPISMNGDRLHVGVESDRLPADLLDELKAHKAELLAMLSAESRIRAWLDRIGETDEVVITEALDLCQTDPAALAYYLARATEITGRPLHNQMKGSPEL